MFTRRATIATYLLILPLVVLFLARREHHAYSLQELSAPGCLDSRALAINNRRQVVGWCSGADKGEQALLWQNGTATKLQTSVGSRSRAYGINEAGQVVGAVSMKPGVLHAVLWEQGQSRNLGTLGGQQSEARAVNAQGQIVGWAETPQGHRHAFVWQKGRMRDLGTLGGRDSEAIAVNNRGQVVGWAQISNLNRHAILWENGQRRDLGTLGGPQSEAHAINESGLIVGYADTVSCARHAFRCADGALTDIDAQAALSEDSDAYGINAHGQIVGLCSGLRVDGNNGESAAFFLREKRFDLLRQFQPIASAYRLEEARCLNDRGDMVANTGNGKSCHALLLTAP